MNNKDHLTQRLMDYSFRIVFANDELINKVKSRLEKEKGKPDFELYISGMELEKSRTYLQRRSGDSIGSCRLCYPRDSIIYRKYLAITPDDFPFYKYHMLLRPLKKGFDKTNYVQIDQRIGLLHVNKYHLDCRDYFTSEDVKIMSMLVQDTDYLITQSMKGSGASIPEHIHAHAIKRNDLSFPLLDISLFNQIYLSQDINIFVLRLPSYAICIQSNPDIISHLFGCLSKRMNLPSNHIFCFNEKFGGLIGVYIPRIKEIPTGSKFYGWQFGAFEVLGLFCIKTLEVYYSLRYQELSNAIKEVTLHDYDKQKQIEDYLISLTKSLS